MLSTNFPPKWEKKYVCFEVVGKLHIGMEYSEKIVCFLSNFFEAGIDHIAFHRLWSEFWRWVLDAYKNMGVFSAKSAPPRKVSKQDCMYVCCMLLYGRNLEAGGHRMAADLLHAEYVCGVRIQCAGKREITRSLHLAGWHNMAACDFIHTAVQVGLSFLCSFVIRYYLYIHKKKINIGQLASSFVGIQFSFLDWLIFHLY